MKYKNLTLGKLKQLAKTIYKEIGPNRRVIGLVGPLGSGKTTFSKAMAEALGVKSAKSPTFTLVHCYTKGANSLYHIDLYRLEKASELAALGLDEIIDEQPAPVIIEWADKFPRVLEKCQVVIKFEPSLKENNLRNVTVTFN